jgi:hypothetical protein
LEKFYFQKHAQAYCNDGFIIVNSEAVGLGPGANPTNESYNASIVKKLQRQYCKKITTPRVPFVRFGKKSSIF